MPAPLRIFLTGATGFIGTRLLPELRAAGHVVVTGGRELTEGGGGQDPDLEGVDVVIHLAGIAHRQASPAELDRINARWPVELFRHASANGVADFLFMSSIKVLGDVSVRPLRETDPYRPGDDYARSKMQAEQGLRDAAAAADRTRLTIVRSPLVYGPGVRANFLTLLRLAVWGARGLPLPLGRATAPRSFVGLNNLASGLSAAIGAGGIIHCSDPEDLSVAALLRRLGAKRLLPVPAHVMAWLLSMAGGEGTYERLFRPLQIDRQASSARIGWVPPYSVDAQLEETLTWFRQSR